MFVMEAEPISLTLHSIASLRQLGLSAADVLTPVTVEKPLKGQILIYVWPMDTLVIDLHVV